jgi:hypothetical protein
MDEAAHSIKATHLTNKKKAALLRGVGVAAFKFGKGWGQLRTLAPYAG